VNAARAAHIAGSPQENPQTSACIGTVSRTVVVAVAEPGLLERDREMAAIAAAIAEARAGNGRLVVVEGPAGIGKSHLIAAIRAGVRAAGLDVLQASGGELEREFAHGVVRQLFEPALASATAADRAELLGGAAALAAPLFGGPPPGGDGVPGPDGSFAVEHGLFWLTANLAARRPLLLAVDDLHWADAPSLRALVYVRRRLEGLPVVLLVGLRPHEPGVDERLVDAVLSDPGRVVLRPRRLSSDGSARLLEATLGGPADAGFAAACHEATGGNPLLLRELALAFGAEGLAATAEHADVARRLGSQALAGRIRARLARLAPDAARLAQAAAVLGDGCDARDVATLAELDAAAAAAAAELLARTEVIRRDPAVAFVHPVVRAAVYTDVPPAARARAHARAARLLAAAGRPPEQVAAHAMLAPPSGDAWIVAVLREAARRALAEGAADVAVAQLERALRERPAPEEGADVLLELGLAEAQVRAPAAIEHLADALGSCRDPQRRAHAALELARGLFAVGRAREAVELLDGTIAELEAASADLAARLEAERIGLARFSPTQHAAAVERLGRLARRPARPGPGRSAVLANLASEAARRGEDRAEAVDLARRALADGTLVGEHSSAAFTYAVQALAYADELEAAAAAYGDALAAAAAGGAISRFAFASCFRAGVALRAGALSHAEADARQALDAIDAFGLGVARFYATGFLVDALIERGELAEAAALVEATSVDAQAAGSYVVHGFLDSRARLRLVQGRTAEGAEELLALGRALEGVGVRNPGIISWRSEAALALVRLGDRVEARRLAGRELELAERWGAARAIGRALRALGLATGGEDGRALIARAATVLETSAARLDHARALADLGAALRRAGRRADAREPLRMARDLAHRCGARTLADAAHGELVASGAKPRRLALTGAASLTPSERRVAEMAAGGLTNRDIAQALFVTPKTVEVHLSSSYRKLGIGARSQLPRALAA
jgi:DNA-binding CsgD family transcriptional regulator